MTFGRSLLRALRALGRCDASAPIRRQSARQIAALGTTAGTSRNRSRAARRLEDQSSRPFGWAAHVEGSVRPCTAPLAGRKRRPERVAGCRERLHFPTRSTLANTHRAIASEPTPRARDCFRGLDALRRAIALATTEGAACRALPAACGAMRAQRWPQRSGKWMTEESVRFPRETSVPVCGTEQGCRWRRGHARDGVEAVPVLGPRRRTACAPISS